MAKVVPHWCSLGDAMEPGTQQLIERRNNELRYGRIADIS